ncbi:MAG: CvpA family protein [Armatimonadota bacterium]
MNWLDFIIILLMAYSAYAGTKGGFLLGVIELVGIAVSIAIPLALWVPGGHLLVMMGVSKPIAGLTAFFVILAIVMFVYFPLMQMICKKILKHLKASPVNKYLGAITGLIRGLIVISMLITLAAVAPVSPLSQASLDKSFMAQEMLKTTLGMTASISQTFGTAVHEAMGFITINPTSDESINLGYKAANPTIDEAAEKEMLILLNQERTSRGLNSLILDPAIRNVARGYSIHMLQNGFFSHTAPNGTTPVLRMQAGGVRFTIAGENLAYAPTVKIAHSGLMKSPGHKANILNPGYTRIGIGVAHAGKYRTVFTQNFAR